MTCSRSAANALGLNKQDNSNDTCAADLEQIIIWLANSTITKITETMTCSKSTFNALGLRKSKQHRWCILIHWTDHYIVETYAMTSKH